MILVDNLLTVLGDYDPSTPVYLVSDSLIYSPKAHPVHA